MNIYYPGNADFDAYADAETPYPPSQSPGLPPNPPPCEYETDGTPLYQVVL
jgi:hypothetical protein